MSKLTFHLIPHTHWDREWYLPRGRFGSRLIAMVDDLVELLEGEPAIPGFLLDGQTVLLEDYMAVRPGQRDRIRRLVSQGRIDTGPWYVLADEQIPSGEALIRNLQLGVSDCAAWGGGTGPLYSPDAFGHPAILPTIAAEFGIDTGVAWRGISPERDLFHWQGPDRRSVVLVYHLPQDGYEIGSGLSSRSAEARLRWEPVRRAVVGRAASSQVAVFVGADHHAARTDLLELRSAIAGLEPEHEVRLSRLGEFLDAVRNTGGLATRYGELRQEGHTWTLQGVHGTRAHLKRRNSRLELWLERFAEPMSALSRLAGGRDSRARLDWAWRTLVQTQFHDVLGGCASDEVAQAAEVRQTDVEGMVRELVRESAQQILGWDPDRARDNPDRVRPSLVIWNPAPREREGIVLATVTRFRSDVLVGPPGHRVPRTQPAAGDFALATGNGERIPVQVLETVPALERLDARAHYPDLDEVESIRIAFEAPPVRGMSGEVLTLVPGERMPAWLGADAGSRRLANQFVTIEVERDGSLSLLDRSTGRQRSRVLRLELEGDRGDTYTFCPGRPATVRRPSGPASVRVLAAGPLVAALEVASEIGPVALNLLVILFRDDPVVRCTLRLDNRGQDQRLRARFSPGGGGMPACAGAQLGSQVRAAVTHRPPVLETPVATAPAHRFLGVGGSAPFALFVPGFFEYELEPGGDILFTILRSVGQLSRGDLATRPGHAGWPTATPLAQCPGPDAIDLAFALGDSDWGDPARLQEAWEDLFVRLAPFWVRDWNGTTSVPTGLELEGDGLALSALAPARAGAGVVMRCFNLRDRDVQGRARFGFPVEWAERVRADETVLEKLDPAGNEVRFRAGPREMVSLLVRSRAGSPDPGLRGAGS